MSASHRFGRVLVVIFRPILWLLFPYKVDGREHIPPAAPGTRTVLCSNHVSNMDPVFLLLCQKRPIYYMAKVELFRNWFTRWLFGDVFGAFSVTRGAGDTGALDRAKQIVEEGKLMGIFPEGTRSRDGKLGRAKSGAALIVSQTGAQVLPVCIDIHGVKLRPFHMTHIHFGELLSPEELHLDDSEKPELRYASRLLMERIGSMMAPRGTEAADV